MSNTDIRSGRTRRVGGGTRVVTAAGTIVKLLSADPTRVAIILSAETNGFHVWGDPSGQNSYGSFIQLSTHPPLRLDVETYGSLVTGDIWADATTTPCAIRVLAIVDTNYDGSQG